MSDFWVFGYGSLMWRPGFDVVESQKATVFGLHRTLCIHSWVHRGTQDEPGLVLGLDQGGCCYGMALKAPGTQREAVLAYLRERELVTGVYLEKWRRIRLSDGQQVSALTYVVDPDHIQYAGRLSDAAVCRQVLRGQGISGANVDYVLNTVAHLRETGVVDRHLEAIADRLTAR